MKIYVPPCLGNIVASSAKQRLPARAASPLRAHMTRVIAHDPTWSIIVLAVIKIPDPIIVPVTNEVAPT